MTHRNSLFEQCLFLPLQHRISAVSQIPDMIMITAIANVIGVSW
jgi:hypothetical protein